MRTTIILDLDVFNKIRQKIKKENKTMREVINSALRKSFSNETTLNQKTFRIDTFTSDFKVGVDSSDFNSLIDDLDIADYKNKHKRNKANK